MAKANGEPVSINFVLHDNDIAWQIRDVYLDSAISELAATPVFISLTRWCPARLH